MPTKQDNALLWLPTDLLIKKFHPDNPREHSWEEGEDLEDIKKSLIGFGWLTYPTINTKTDGEFDYLLSGHGRVLVADNLKQIEDSEFWSNEWDRWLKSVDKDNLDLKKHQQRFKADYWQNCPVVPVNLDEESSNAALIRLNNTSKDGQDNPAKLAVILNKLPKKQVNLAGWDETNKKVFVSAYIKQKEQQPEKLDREEDDYNDSRGANALENYDRHLDNEDNTSELSEESENFNNDYEEEKEISNEELLEETDNLQDTLAVNQTSSYNYDPTNQTRLLVYLDKSVLQEFKAILEELAVKLDIDAGLDVHQRRSQTLLETIRQFNTILKIKNNE